ncbi:MAG TPA: S8 family serine peptidase [Parvibaculum sp.]
MRLTSTLIIGVLTLASVLAPGAAEARKKTATVVIDPYSISPQNVLNGAKTVQATGITGAGVVFGVIDTGTAAAWVGFGDRIMPLPVSGCVITPSCDQSLAVTDDNGHGTFVSSEIVGSVPYAGLTGVAPGGSVIAVKVLDGSGSGGSEDVGSGIVYAASQGAQVLNLSLGPFTQDASIISAINTAAAEGVYIVFAGGNSSAFLNGNRNITGLTDQAIQHLIFVGSTNSKLRISSFSNKPGSAGFISTTGKFYAYDTMWLMADGENIWGASNYSTPTTGYSYITQMSGTSMAAPQVAGAVGLLLQKWPFLYNTGTALRILEATGQDLGARGVDTIYGSGFLRVDLAFKPVGKTQLLFANGGSSTTSSMAVSSGKTLGSLSGLRAVLSKSVAFDSFHRDFPVDINSMISRKPGTSGNSIAPAQVTATPLVSHFALNDDGSTLTMVALDQPTTLGQMTQNPRDSIGIDHLVNPAKPVWSLSYRHGSDFVGTGQGADAPVSFSEARWDGASAFTGTDAEASGALLGLTDYAQYAAMGFSLGQGTRFSMAMLQGEDDTLYTIGAEPQAHGFALGYTFEPQGSPDWQVSLTTSMLQETDMLLGSPSSGALNLGSNRSTSVGLGTNFNLGGGYRLGFDAAYVTTTGDAAANSMIAGVSHLASTAFGAALSKDQVVSADDALSLTLKKPLRVTSGSALVDYASGNDLYGNAVFSRARASLVPSGSETDLGVNYSTPLSGGISGNLYVGGSNDTGNVAGAHDLGAMVRLQALF